MATNPSHRAILVGGSGRHGASGTPQGEDGAVGEGPVLRLAPGQANPFTEIRGGQGGHGGHGYSATPGGHAQGGAGGVGKAPDMSFLRESNRPVPAPAPGPQMDMSKPMVIFLAHSDDEAAAVYERADTFPSLDEFCTRYRVSDDVRARLTQLDDGVSSVVGLLGVTGNELQGAGFNEGQVAQLGESLRSFLRESNLLAQ
ncbi:hypothetical protein HMN09_00377300 [Mycena chlorophos]|uniref:Uncharacterized protein n=1 Tax=Mycena chlorophos TaxID=658473 RepID=A0A8H6TL00_MYCCL|nr:hypothetical protein HMN09_00377300 [Mycena chlorophos]